MFEKKALSSFTTFLLLVIFFFFIFLFSLEMSSYFKEDYLELQKEKELNSLLLDFRGELISLTILSENSSLLYSPKYVEEEIQIFVGDSLQAIYLGDFKQEKEIGLLSINICSNFSFYPSLETSFTYNGSCISLS